MDASKTQAKHFIEQQIEQDLADRAYGDRPITTRFPPEPNGYLHIGHAKAICLNFTMAEQYQGHCHLRFDDTNPVKEDKVYMNAIQADIRWLGFNWDSLHHTADYFEQLYSFAVTLIKQGNAFVCSLSGDDIRTYRGTLTEPGQDSPFRNRSIDENLDLFSRMRAGEFKEGEHVLRAKIDMQSGNVNLRDPIIYRILHQTHPHTGDAWCIYPMYDFAHSLSDAIEHITHSLCSLEFQDHRPLYNWFIENLTPKPWPQQYEFSRLQLSHTVLSKRKLKLLVDNQHVNGWDDPRMPTLAGVRRRGYPPSAIRKFCKDLGVTKSDSVLELSLLEEYVRNDLNHNAPRAMCVLKPLKLVIDNLPEEHIETLKAPNHPQRPELGEREIPFSREIYIEQDDFMEVPVKKYRRLKPDGEVRLRYGYVIKCNEIIKDEQGNIVELRCSYDPNTLGKDPEGRKVKGVIHWVSAPHAKACQVNIYDRLFSDPNPGASATEEELLAKLNPESLSTLQHAHIEPNLSFSPLATFQFERLGYFCVDDMQPSLSFNRVVALRDNWQAQAAPTGK